MKKHLLYLLAILLVSTSCKETLCENDIYPFCEQEEEPVTLGTITEKGKSPSGIHAVVFSLQGKGYMATGSLRFPPSDGGANQLIAYNASEDKWTRMASMPDRGRLRAVGFATDTKGYVGGGNTITGHDGNTFVVGDLKDFWEYDPKQDNWTQKADLPGGEGNYDVGFSILNKGYVAKDNKLWEYHPGSDTWVLKGDFPFNARVEMFIIGPLAYAVEEGKLWEYNPHVNKWRARADFPGGGASTAFSTTTKGYVINGYAIWEYNPYSNKWYEKVGTPIIGKDSNIPPQGQPNDIYPDYAFEVDGKGYFGLYYRGGFAEHFYEYDPNN
ncbi:Kelch repeat-containing protein [Pontibacter harenae]|uniref:Kelch repeat-containing protein n=1 Tax=Pontibacter harenae TaxID=2894083 RepID=UPI001E2D0C11|nr:hypothetical protein [Pontibacter harenae]MCC9166266.1 hypothetical protein [Pontibacter harenae]